MKGKCNLCEKTKELQKVCHVIPDFFYRESKLYHEHHNIVNVDLRTFLATGKKNVISKNQKTGEFDLYQFCKDCDGKIIGQYESYAREFFYARQLPKGKKLIISYEKGYVECSNANYTKLKLLFLSILWRASLSKRRHFSEISLGDELTEKIRKMLLNGESLKDTELPVFFMNTVYDKSISNDYLFKPIRMRVANENGFMFAFGGMIVIYTIGINGIPDSFLKYRIQENGVFRTLKVPPGETWNLIKDWYEK